MKTYNQLVDEIRGLVQEIFPWDLQKLLDQTPSPLLLDVREPAEFSSAHIAGSINVPRGILESACEFGYAETVPELARAHQRCIVVICRSGNRSVLAAHTLRQLGYAQPVSLKTGIKGWNDFDLPLIDDQGTQINAEEAESLLMPALRADQLPTAK